MAILVYFKYSNFFIDNINTARMWVGWPGNLSHLNVLLPIGLSFFTFQSISYLIDVKRGGIIAEKNLIDLLTYFLFFPKIIAGPIERSGPFLKQLKASLEASESMIQSGLLLCLTGFFKKLVVADRLGVYVDNVYSTPELFGSGDLITATIFFTIQLYCDFSGYCDIGMGIARMLGIRLTQNFNHPLFAESFSDFWKRWHITLSSWLRDYIFIPFCGRRAKYIKIYSSILIVFFISGLWHGANWTFIVWGLMHGTFIVFENIYKRFFETSLGFKVPEWLRRGLSIIVTFILVAFTRIFFKSNSIEEAFEILKRIVNVKAPPEFSDGRFFIFLALAFILLYEVTTEFFKERLSLNNATSQLVKMAFTVSVIVLILLMGEFEGGRFIYSRF
ncbi:MBOAT family O-acyltransferase [Solitalea lacus]|uniref:MBOAT family O-acyltransferase n=1 Tax=Solitalea lacus TaxID=2911172 RepID=UPI001EDBA6DE|nr:MBOAT family O-acyltransferase [Solitalea lacus]UKJ07216.1 MBOAT family protein [Solitalea lacus]